MKLIDEFKRIIKSKKNGLTDEQVMKIYSLMEFWAKLEFENFKNKTQL
jgi:hypothetical protein